MPFVGVGIAWLRDPLGAVAGIRDTYGPVARFRLGPERAWLISECHRAREIFMLGAEAVQKGPSLKRARRLLGDGLLVSEGPIHRERRRILRPALAREAVNRRSIHAAEVVATHHARWTDGEPLLVQHAMTRMVLDLTARNLLGAQLDDADVDVLTDAMEVLLGRFWVAMLPKTAWLEQLPVGPLSKLAAAYDAIDAVIGRAITRHHEGAGGGGALDQLASSLDDSAVRDEVVNLLFAGAETTASMLAWTWVLLSTHGPAQRRVQDEADRGEPGPDASLPYIDAVMSEALRLYPPVWLTTRRMLVDHDLRGHAIRAGDLVMLDMIGMLRDATYFPEPDAFRPERWLTNPPDHEVAMMFGAGPRKCPGERFARTTGAIAVAEIARHWELVPHRAAVTPRVTVTLQPHGATLVVRRR
jgi:cytochrome P450